EPLDIPYGDYLQSLGAPAAALPLLAIGAQLGSLDAESALWKLHGIKFSMDSMASAMAQKLPFRQYVPGGMSRLTDAMAASLAAEVRLNTAVTGIENRPDGVTVSAGNGRRYAADFAICTLPLPVLRSVPLSTPLPATAAAAVREIPYGRATSVVLKVLDPYWEADGMPPNLWTDTVLQRAFLNPSPTGEGQHLWVFNTGDDDLSQRDWSDAEIGDYVLQQINALRPSTTGRLEVGAVRTFTRDPLVGGTYASRAPGQVKRFKNVLADRFDRLVLAGEHTAGLNSGMEGAMESGERAALVVSAA
ncbi:MAG: NAD(P)/FAD-dependent oxidoreductase, partial [Gammaproteobacteria bacterium]|nr:NAD(P)/FAD-dependent oxidoreductase [Gammaproteobacteria bacterium]